MSKLSEYNPLHALKIPGVAEQIETKGLVVIVGPNSSGKTLLLKDIESKLTGSDQSFVVCQEMFLKRPADWSHFLNDLLAQGLMEQKADQVKIASPHLGRGMRDDTNYQMNALIKLEKTLNDGWAKGGKVDVFGVFGRLLLTSLFLENRLLLYVAQQRFDQYAQGPQNDLQALFLNSDAQEKLAAETGKVFGNVAWLDIVTRFQQFVLRVSGNSDLPPPANQRDPRRADTYRLIDDEGHGFKSYVGIAIALLLGRRPVCLIDEPELCLHPPQQYALGRFIGEYGTTEPHVTFVATHSSHTLRGIIETAKRLTVLRLTNIGGAFRGHLVNDQELRAAIKRRTTRAETVLDGIFSQVVALVEAEGDRAVYQAAAETNGLAFGREVHFVAVHGTGGIADIFKFYRTLRIPVAIMADLDVVSDKPKRKAFLEELATPTEAAAVLQLCDNVDQAVRQIPPAISESDVIRELDEIKASARSWQNRDDIQIRQKLSGLREKVDRIHKLKQGGVAAFDSYPEIKRDLEEVIRRCREVGLFLAPCGQLENWIPHLMEGISKKYKAEWADEAARRIREATNTTGDVWQFVKAVVTFLDQRARGGESGGPLAQAVPAT